MGIDLTGGVTRTGWKPSTQNKYATYVETVYSSVGAGNHFTSVIDFLPPGKDFTIIANAAGTTFSVSTWCEMWACDTADGTFVRVQARLTDASTTALRNVTITPHCYQWDGSVDGWYPYYKLNYKTTGATAVDDVHKTVIMFVSGNKD